jgi:hypothetical protein
MFSSRLCICIARLAAQLAVQLKVRLTSIVLAGSGHVFRQARLVVARLAAKMAVQLKAEAGSLADCLIGIGGSSVMLV